MNPVETVEAGKAVNPFKQWLKYGQSVCLEAAIDEAVPVDVLSAALFVRFRSRQEHTFAEKMLSAMRQKFGGHAEPKAAKKNA